ncbi:MAG TPA: HDIG domain-containing protein, partial [Anaerolineae bacterium]
LWLLALLAATAILVLPLPFSGQIDLKQGDVAPADVVAPRQATYVSAIRTQKLRDLAAAAVPDVYDPPQTRIARQQLAVATQLLSYIGTVRSDPQASTATKSQDLAGVKSVTLPANTVAHILSLPQTDWERIASETQAVLDQTMRGEIRDVDLAAERTRVPTRVRLDLSDEDAAVVSQLVQSLLVPNSVYNAVKTDEARQNARAQVQEATVSVVRGEIILRAGDIVTAEDMEALNALGLKQAAFTRQDLERSGAFVLLIWGLFLYYLWCMEPEFWLSSIKPVLLFSTLLPFILAARILVSAHALLPYIFPYAALTMLVAVLINLRLALVTGVFFILLVGWLTTGSVELMTYAFAASLVGALRLRRGDHLSQYALAGLYVAAVNILVVVAFRLTAGRLDLRGTVELLVAGLTNGLIAITVALVGSYAAGVLFGLTTPLQLMELSRPTHPLLRQLLLKAPGTYHHTLIVGNMAERAAEAIGADAQLARVGAYYHDVGKIMRPYFFAENRTEDQDPHSRIDPYTSAQIIINHVQDGIELARRYRLPAGVAAFIPEHHGTLPVAFFYHAAIKLAEGSEAVDRAKFTYPGPRPRSRETAITMLADCAEATVRAKHPTSGEEISRIVNDCIQMRVTGGQLDDSGLTLGDLQTIQAAFLDVLRGIHHPRIVYPNETRVETPEAAPVPAAPADAPEEAHDPVLIPG